MITDTSIDVLAAAVGAALRNRGESLATAESCTGGLVAAAITAIAGSSEWVDRGFVTYSNEAKRDMLSVEEATLAMHGAVSEATVLEMAVGALGFSQAEWALAISGIAGPTGGSPGKPVGTVCFAWAGPDHLLDAETCRFDGDREAVRKQAVVNALRGLLQRLEIPARA